MFWEVIKNVGQKHFLWQRLRYVFSGKKSGNIFADFFGECQKYSTLQKQVFFNKNNKK